MVNPFTALVCYGVLAAILFGGAASAQEDKWRELQALTGKLIAERRFDDALRTGAMAVTVAQKTWGRESARMADSLNNLAMLYFYANRPDDAEDAYRRAIESYDSFHGPLHFRSLNAHKSLARLCDLRGKHDCARKHYVDALKISEARFGAAHPATEEVLYNLGRLLMAQGQMVEANRYLRRVLAIRSKRHGPRSIEVVQVLKPLIRVYKNQGVYEGLDAVGERVLEIERKAVDPSDPRLIDTHTDLGDIYSRTDRPALAETHYRRALALREELEGPDYYPEQEAYTNFARVTVTGEGADNVFTTWNRSVGKDHVARIEALNNLARTLRAQGKSADALPLYQRARAIAERAYGPDHRATALAVKNLAETYYALGRMDAAKPHYERIVRLCDRAHKKDDATLLQYLDILSLIYFAEARYDEAAATYRKIATLQRKTLGASHPNIASTLNNLGEVERLRGNSKAAETAYLAALALYDEAEGMVMDVAGLRAVLTNLIRLYESTDRKTMAAPYCERIATLRDATSTPRTIVLP